MNWPFIVVIVVVFIFGYHTGKIAVAWGIMQMAKRKLTKAEFIELNVLIKKLGGK